MTNLSDGQLYAGLMSGTSIDSIDAAIIDFHDDQIQLIATKEYSIPEKLKAELASLCLTGEDEIERMGQADNQLGHLFAEAVEQLLNDNPINSNQIKAIGSHGQTIRHRANTAKPFTLQIGDPNIIAYKTGITTVADFRRKDMAAGGQGAPLAPAFHQAMFSSNTINRAIINIGGIANITFLGKDQTCFGYDTGPGNGLMDAWIHKHKNISYDENGDWASTGSIIHELLAKMFENSYFALPHPKSTGREEFNLLWLESIIDNKQYRPEDVQATLLAFTAHSITNEIRELSTINEIYICGGGAYNNALMSKLETLAHPISVTSTEILGIAPKWVEAAAFAWLAKQTMERKPGNLNSVTGAKESVILGAIHLA